MEERLISLERSLAIVRNAGSVWGMEVVLLCALMQKFSLSITFFVQLVISNLLC